jgi:DNA-binding GntR family transcriptional regulator
MDSLSVNHQTLTDKVYELLQNEILSGQASPGTQLEVVALAKRLGVSRTPVKEAVSRLIMEGLVQDLPRKGYFVSKRDSEDISELVDARLMLELAAVERGLQMAEPAEIAQMRRLLADIDGIMDDQGWYVDYEAFIRKDSELHFSIVGTARNRHLLDAYRRIYRHFHAARMHLALGPGYRRGLETRQDHLAILAAFETKDLPALKTAMTKHLQDTKQWFAAAQARTDEVAASGLEGVHKSLSKIPTTPSPRE